MNRATSRVSTDEAKQQRLKVKREVDTCTDQDEDSDGGGGSGHAGPRRGAFPGTGSAAKRGSAAGAPARCCQAERCAADLGDAKLYHRRHRVCEHHAKAQVVLVGGIRQRFCQQCSRFHELAEFDEVKRSCRRRLAGHNERRRKSAAEAHVEGSGRKGAGGGQLKDLVCGKVDERGRIQISIQDSASYKHFHIR